MYQKMFAVGNSLTCGFGNHGMASTTVETDWFYHVVEGLRAKNPEMQAIRATRGGWEGEETSEARRQILAEVIEPMLEPGIDLVLIQLGDNVNTDERRTTFREDAAEMIRWFREKCPGARVIWIYGWYNMEDNMELLKGALADVNGELADISHHSPFPEHRNVLGGRYIGGDGEEHIIESVGVASHPNDLGMKKIAETVLETIFGE